MSFLKSLFSGKSKAPARPAFSAEIQTDQPLIVIGDVHGMASLLDHLMSRIGADRLAKSQLVFVGDLVDRGENSAEALAKVQQMCLDGAICIKGNHEKMMLDFLDHPEISGQRWLRNGGLQTVMSFGVGGVTANSGAEELVQCRDSLLDAMPDGMVDWLRGLPVQYNSGNVHVVHAAAEPDLPMSQQSDDTLIWGHGDFRKVARTDGQWVVHGHTIVDVPTVSQGVISTDTGAFATGKLSAAVIHDGTVEFVQS